MIFFWEEIRIFDFWLYMPKPIEICRTGIHVKFLFLIDKMEQQLPAKWLGQSLYYLSLPWKLGFSAISISSKDLPFVSTKKYLENMAATKENAPKLA